MSTKQKLILYWSRRDFRLTDNPALWSAVQDSTAQDIPFLPVFIIEDYMLRADPESQFGYPSRYFLSHAVPEYAKQFAQFLLCSGKAGETLITIGNQYDITVYVNEDVWIDFYKQIKKLKKRGVVVKIFKDFLTVDRETKTGQGNYYSVFTPFKNAVWKEFLTAEIKPKVNLSKVSYLPKKEINALTVNKLTCTQSAVWSSFSHARTLQIGKTIIDLDTHTQKPDLQFWYTTEDEALSTFKVFLKSDLVSKYSDNRDSLEKDTEELKVGKTTLRGKTSKMSLALAWGLVSARTLRSEIQGYYKKNFLDQSVIGNNPGVISFLNELIWREFYKYLYFHNTDLINTEFQKKLQNTIQWTETKEAKKRFIAWIEGKTGYSVVDAAMNQLARTGWMHNRSRMIVASILTKNLGVDWRWGQEYFRSALIDLDETSNNGGWQWGASVGADPKPIRIFNAELQAKNYDSSGAYQKKWLPDGTVSLPIVEHKVGRDEALKRYGLPHHKLRDY